MMDLQAFQIRARWLMFLCLIGLLGCDGAANEVGPNAPRLVAPENGSGNQITALELQWSIESGASFYHVQLSQSDDFSTLIVEDDHVNTDAYPVKDLEVGKTYYWRVRGGNDAGFGEWADTWQFKPEKEGDIPPIPKLSTPSNAAVDLPTQLDFRWNPVNDASTYHIQVSLERNFVRRIADIEGVRGTSVNIRELVPTYLYYWRVRSKNPLGYSEWSPTWFVVIEDDSVLHILG